jgi:hypothetical protein
VRVFGVSQIFLRQAFADSSCARFVSKDRTEATRIPPCRTEQYLGDASSWLTSTRQWLAVDYGQAPASFGGDGDDPAAWRSISSAREEQGVARAGRRERTEN